MADRSSKRDDGRSKDIPMEDASSHSSSSSVIVPIQSENPAKDKKQPSAGAQTSQGGSSSRRVIDQVIEGNESSKGTQVLAQFKLPKTVAKSLIQGGGVSQKIVGNVNKGDGQKIGGFEVYDG